MIEIDVLKIKEIALGLAQGTQGLKRRFFMSAHSFDDEPRIKVLRGFRGVGKTTALLQLMERDRAIYFSVDHPYIEGYSLYELSKQLIKSGYKTLLIDEIQYYPNWKQETKALYDEFREVVIIISGSAPLAFEPERRYDIIDVEPLSLKEFCEIEGRKIEVEEIWGDTEKTLVFLAANPWIYEQYECYLRQGAFPIYFKYREKTLGSIYQSIKKSIREDVPFFSRVDGETIRAMERLLLLLATAELGDFSINSIAKTLEITKYKGYEIVSLLEAMRILRLIRPHAKGPKLVRGDPKLMFYHPNLRWAVCSMLGVTPSRGALREELAVFSFIQRGWKVSTIKGMKKNPDYLIERHNETILIEIGGSSKTTAQFAGMKGRKEIIDDRRLITLAWF